MTDTFHSLGEPPLLFGNGQTAEDPHDGLALFGPAESCAQRPKHVVMGTPEGLALWKSWCDDLNSPAACVVEDRDRAWPPYPGFDVAFGTRWPSPIRNYEVDAQALSEASRKSDKYERAYAVTGLFMQAIERTIKLDAKPALAICIVPDEVYENCHPNSSVALDERSDTQRTRKEKKFLDQALFDRKHGQTRMFDDADDNVAAAIGNIDAYEQALGLSPDFRRQLKARMMAHDLPVQIIREATLRVSAQVRNGEKGTNPLSDRLWNFSTALYYKCGAKPWKTPWAREGVCYVGLAYKITEDGRQACCAAQMFLDSGDGVYVDRPRPRPDDWGSEVRGLHEGLTAAAEAEGAAFDEEAEGGLQQQRHPGLPEEQSARPIEREQDATPGDDDDSDPAADRRAMTSLSNVARAVAMNEGKQRGSDILPSFGGDM